MPGTTRVLTLLVLLTLIAALAAGCSKPLSPVTRDADGALRSVAAGRAGAGSDPIPSPYIVRLKFVGPVVTLNSAYEPVLDRNAEFLVYSTGSLPPAGAEIDTVAAYSELKLAQWKRTSGPESAAPFTSVPEYEVEAPVFGTDPPTLRPGLNIIRLKVPPQIGTGWVRVAFHMGFSPGAWWAGPDPALFPPSSDGDGRAVDVSDWSHFTTTPAWPPDGRGYFGPDSFRFVPSQRLPVRGDLERRTFYEIFGDRIYARAEGDTVHQDAWVVLAHAGYDRDSRYVPLVNPADPALPAGYASSTDLYSALIPQGMLGSPTAFLSVVTFKLPDGSQVRSTTSSPYPNFSPFSVLRNAHMAGYWQMHWPGKAYAAVQAEDAEGLRSRLPGDFTDIADRVDAGGGTPEDRLLRRHILTFHVRPAAAAPSASGADDASGGVNPGTRARR